MASEFTIRCQAKVTGTITVTAENESVAWDIAVQKNGDEIDPDCYTDCEPLRIISKCEHIVDKGD